MEQQTSRRWTGNWTYTVNSDSNNNEYVSNEIEITDGQMKKKEAEQKRVKVGSQNGNVKDGGAGELQASATVRQTMLRNNISHY
jgi:hypothetical protein